MLTPVLTPLSVALLATGFASHVSGAYSPRVLFTQGQKGAWYDPSDLSTLFQDAAGTIPVTGTGQPVGLMLDKSTGLVRGAEISIPSGWATSTTGMVVDTSAATIAFTGAQAAYGSRQLAAFDPAVAGRTFDVSFTVTGWVQGRVQVRLGGVQAYVTGNGTYTFKQLTIGAGVPVVQEDGGTGSRFIGVVGNISIKQLPGNHATQATAASRPIFRDVGGLRYLECDGVDDGMVTGSIDFTGTGKMLVCAGVRKLSDAATGALLELSSSSGANSGTFALFSPTGALPTYGIRVRGTAEATPSISGIPSPDSSVVSLLGYIADDVSVIRRNGVVGASSSNDLGTGNYGNHPLYLFRRGGASLAFNGLFYGAIIAGSTYSAAQIASAERYLAGKSGVTV